MEAFYNIEPDVSEVIHSVFANEVTNAISASRSCMMLPVETDAESSLPSISSYESVFTFEINNADQNPLSKTNSKHSTNNSTSTPSKAS